MELNELTVIVTHYQTPALLQRCLTRLTLFAPDATLIVVTSSPEPEPKQLQRDFSTEVLQVANHSMANGVNAGLKLARTPYILQMNADVMLAASTIPAMLSALAQPGVGMVGPRCRTPAGSWQAQGLYNLNYLRLELSGRPSISVPWLSGCCQMLKREVIMRVGGMDSSLRFYNEDIEWCWRVRRAGYACQLLRASVLHIGGASTPKDAKFILEGLRGGYVLTQRHKPSFYQSAHRLGVLLYAFVKTRTTRTPGEREMYQNLFEMFRHKSFAESPFGPTLSEPNPHFLRRAHGHRSSDRRKA